MTRKFDVALLDVETQEEAGWIAEELAQTYGLAVEIRARNGRD